MDAACGSQTPNSQRPNAAGGPKRPEVPNGKLSQMNLPNAPGFNRPNPKLATPQQRGKTFPKSKPKGAAANVEGHFPNGAREATPQNGDGVYVHMGDQVAFMQQAPGGQLIALNYQNQPPALNRETEENLASESMNMSSNQIKRAHTHFAKERAVTRPAK